MRRVDVKDIELRDDGAYYLDGVPFTGIGCEYDSSGRIRCEMAFESGVHQGRSRDWYPSGAIREEAEYRYNTLHGELVAWNEAGKVTKRERYEFGICTESREWDDDGSLVSEFHLAEDDPQYDLLKMFRASVFTATNLGQ